MPPFQTPYPLEVQAPLLEAPPGSAQSTQSISGYTLQTSHSHPPISHRYVVASATNPRVSDRPPNPSTGSNNSQATPPVPSAPDQGPRTVVVRDGQANTGQPTSTRDDHSHLPSRNNLLSIVPGNSRTIDTVIPTTPRSQCSAPIPSPHTCPRDC